MRACGDCSKPVKKVGPPVLHGVFLDQIIDCPACGWCGIETTVVDPVKYEREPRQLEMFVEDAHG